MRPDDRKRARAAESEFKRRRIRQQVGSNYGILPLDESRWLCLWHRRPAVLPAYVCDSAPEDQSPSPQCEEELRVLWPAGLRSNVTDSLDLVRGILPDDRQFVLIPFDAAFKPPLLVREWKATVGGGAAGKGPLLKHARDISLHRLQVWHRVGKETLRRQDELNNLHRQGIVVTDQNNPFRDFQCDHRTWEWISRWASDLASVDAPSFIPSERAWEILADVTGWEPKTIESIVYRHDG